MRAWWAETRADVYGSVMFWLGERVGWVVARLDACFRDGVQWELDARRLEQR
jgi:hypothetical protein